MKKVEAAKRLYVTLGLFLSLVFLLESQLAFSSPLESAPKGPAVLVLFDGPNNDKNPGRLDALYLGNLLGHFTTHRQIESLEDYRPEQWKKFDAVFCVVYQKSYSVPRQFLRDAPQITRPFCWLGNQVGQLDRFGLLRQHGLRFERFFENSPAKFVFYKGKPMEKGDPDANLFRIIDPSQASVIAEMTGPPGWRYPYIVHSGTVWLVADSPFSYATEGDRYLAFADVLHDILGIEHSEMHSALLRLEDINPLSEPKQLQAMFNVIKAHKIPFAFGFVPFYVNPTQRIFLQMSDKLNVVEILQRFIRYGGRPVLHGDTHQYRGVTTDDYEFWDDIADRPVKRDSEAFALRRVEDALKESIATGLYPLTWETPHYAASPIDYRVFKRIFNTVYERRQTVNKLGTDQFFPYPVIDLSGQYVIPENLGYIQKDDPETKDLLASAEAALVVRDGYASFFLHPFLNPDILDGLIRDIEKLGYRFVDLASFPNAVQSKGYLATNESGFFEMGGEGRYLTAMVLSPDGKIKSEKTQEISLHDKIKVSVSLNPFETYIAFRHSIKPETFAQKIFRLAKGDVSVVNRRLEVFFPPTELPEEIGVKLLWSEKARGDEAVDQRSFEVTLQTMGYDVTKVEAKDITNQELGGFSLFVVPAAAALELSPENVERICKAVEGGIVVVTDGETPLARALGIDIGGKIRVTGVDNHLFPTQDLRWPDQPTVPWIEHLSDENDVVFFSEREEKKPLVIGRTLGEGKALYFAPYFDALSGQGYSRFPDFPDLLMDEFHTRPLLKRSNAEAYFDPGFRQNISIEQLAKFWRKFGIRTIHVAAWHFYDKYAYDYERLIKVAHQNGILVYAWFEWPHVSQRFWDQHPSWREKNGFLIDAHIGWRYLMNFQNPRCLKAVMKDTSNLLSRLDWDGVNIAEFHFEMTVPSNKASFTPFNAEARQLFEKRFGFDPLDILKEGSAHYWQTSPQDLQAFYDFRKTINRHLLTGVLEGVKALSSAQKKDMEVIVTMFDLFGHSELADRLGTDGPATLALINHLNCTLQVEDPQTEWSKPPQRYVELGDRYRRMNLKNSFIIDINVLSVHPPTQPGFASDTPSGMELLQLWKCASTYTHRICFYSESTVNESDWELLPYTMAADATVEKKGNDWLVRTPDTVSLELNRPAKRIFMDDRPWFCHDKGSILIPAGEHHISLHPGLKSWFDTSQVETRLLSLTGELLGSEPKKRGLEVEYRSTGRCALRFNKAPYEMFLDEQPVGFTSLRGDDGFVVIAPSGQHRLRVVSESAFLHFLEYTSVVSASLIVLFGTVSSGLLILMFVLIKIGRRTQPVRQRIQRRVFRTRREAV